MDRSTSKGLGAQEMEQSVGVLTLKRPNALADSTYLLTHPYLEGFREHLEQRLLSEDPAHHLGVDSARQIYQKAKAFLRWIESKNGRNDPFSVLQGDDQTMLCLEYLECRAPELSHPALTQVRSSLIQFSAWMKASGKSTADPAKLEAVYCADHPLLNQWRDATKPPPSVPLEVRRLMRFAAGTADYPGSYVKESHIVKTVLGKPGSESAACSSPLISALIGNAEAVTKDFISRREGFQTTREIQKVKYCLRQFFGWLESQVPGFKSPACIAASRQGRSAIRTRVAGGGSKLMERGAAPVSERAKGKPATVTQEDANAALARTSYRRSAYKEVVDRFEPATPELGTVLREPGEIRKTGVMKSPEFIKLRDQVLGRLLRECNPPLNFGEAVNLRIWQAAEDGRVVLVRDGRRCISSMPAGLLESVQQLVVETAKSPITSRHMWRFGFNAALLVSADGNPLVPEDAQWIQECRSRFSSLLIKRSGIAFSKLLELHWPVSSIGSGGQRALVIGHPPSSMTVPLLREGDHGLFLTYAEALMAHGLLNSAGFPEGGIRLPLLCDAEGRAICV